MKLPREEFDARFREYRDALQREVGRLRDTASVLRQINERTHDYLDELNLAPAFFHTVEGALFTTIILWADKLLDEHGERGFFHFLKFVENNRDWMAVKELQRRRNYPDDHWMLRPEHRGPPITFQSIEADRHKLRGLAALQSISLRRNKFHAHFDAEYFIDGGKMQSDAPITWENLAEACATMSVMLNEYSADFDGNTHAAEVLGIDDLTRLLRAARKGRERDAGRLGHDLVSSVAHRGVIMSDGLYAAIGILSPLVQNLILAWAFTAFTNGDSSTFWTAFGVLLGIRLFFYSVDALFSVLSFKLYRKKFVVRKIIEDFQRLSLPKRENLNEDWLMYLQRLQESDAMPFVVRRTAAFLEGQIDFAKRSGFLMGSHAEAAMEAAVDAWSTTPALAIRSQREADEKDYWEYVKARDALRKRYDPSDDWNEATSLPEAYKREFDELRRKYEAMLRRRNGY